jgi:undecaprenyl diphosphate synthase
VNIPKHIAIIMDGNGRWAKKRMLPRVAGHAYGVKRVKEIVEHCSDIGVKYLTLFAFGRENWKRPHEEVSFLMGLLLEQLNKEFLRLHEKDVKIRFVGDKSRLESIIFDKAVAIEILTQNNKKLNLNIALDYSGTYDIIQAVNNILAEGKHQLVTEEIFEKYLLTDPDPAPDLLIRTSGEMRISNFMLWQLAYTEMYFTAKLWPDFNKKALDEAIDWYKTRERRYGKISEQLKTELV